MSNSFKSSIPVGLDLATPHSDGHWINDKVSRIVELIREYDEHIAVQWVPPENRELGDPAFRLMELAPNRPPYIMFYVQFEDEFDERVLERIIRADANKNGISLSAIDAHNDAIKLMKAMKEAEEAEERADLAISILKSPKHTYMHNGVRFG